LRSVQYLLPSVECTSKDNGKYLTVGKFPDLNLFLTNVLEVPRTWLDRQSRSPRYQTPECIMQSINLD